MTDAPRSAPTASANTSVDQALSVLALFVDVDRPIGVTEAARGLGLPISTVHRLLATMEAVGYLERADENGGLRLGINAKELGAAVLDRFPVTAAATSTLGELLRASGQTVSLHVQVAKMVVRVAGRESTSSVAAALRLGETRLCVDTAMGRVLLAFGSSGTSRGRDARSRRLAAEFDEIRAIGHSLTVDETSVHGQTLAWPIVDAAGVAVCVLALEGPAYQFDASPASIRRLKRIAVPLQAEIQANPHLARRPFAHVPDSEVTLRVGG